MFTRTSTVGACAVILGVVMLASVQAGDNWNKTTYLTFSRPVGLPGVTLPQGTYIFELALPGTNTDLVRVMNKERSRVYLTALTLKADRPAGWPADRYVSFGEVPAGATPPVLAWYPPFDAMGHEFVYSGR